MAAVEDPPPQPESPRGETGKKLLSRLNCPDGRSNV